MEIIINNTAFNITAGDLQDADVEFSFWKGRRINIVGADLSGHQLRYNDIVQGILAETATFEEGDDKQQIYTVLSQLKNEGYPYTGPLEIRIVLWFKQLFGNYYREELLGQLKKKLCEEVEESIHLEESESESDIDLSHSQVRILKPDSTTISICNPFFKDVLSTIFVNVGRQFHLQLVTTCKLFHKIITTTDNLDLRAIHQDFHLLKNCLTLDSQNNRNEIFLLLQTYNIKEVFRKIKPCKGVGIFEGFINNELFDILITAVRRNVKIKNKTEQLEYAIALASTDAKSALKIVTAIVKPDMEIELQPLGFCAAAAIYKNSKLCDKTTVLQMGKESHVALHYYSFPMSIGNFLSVFEACLGLDNGLAFEILMEINIIYIHPRKLIHDLQTTAKIIKKHLPLEENITQEAIRLLSKALDLNVFDHGIDPFVETLAVVAITLILLDREKALLALDKALKAVKDSSNKVNSLTLIAEAYAEFDQDQAFEMALQAYDAIKESLEWNKEMGLVAEIGEFGSKKPYLFDFLNRIIKIIAIRDEKYAAKVFHESLDRVHAANGITDGKYYSFGFDHIYGELFIGTLEVFVLLYPKEALKTVKQCVEWVNAVETPESHLLDLGKALAKNFPKEALEIADLLKKSDLRCKVFMAVVNERIDSKIAKSYVERTSNKIFS